MLQVRRLSKVQCTNVHRIKSEVKDLRLFIFFKTSFVAVAKLKLLWFRKIRPNGNLIEEREELKRLSWSMVQTVNLIPLDLGID